MQVCSVLAWQSQAGSFGVCEEFCILGQVGEDSLDMPCPHTGKFAMHYMGLINSEKTGQAVTDGWVCVA